MGNLDSSWEMVIGLEVHAQLSTASKAFSTAKARLSDGESVAEERVNFNTNMICAGHPGTLPSLNKKAVELAIRAGLSTGCDIRLKSVFARKNYFYPDLPKGYQISQFDMPLCENGAINIELSDGKTKRIEIERIHMEEDAGKNVHMSGFSLVNLNRAGVPLIEIVSRPDMRSAEEAGAYLRELHSIVTAIDVCDGNMQEGNFRCDANVSVRKKGDSQLGTRTEIKNVNSFRFVEKAIEYEAARQVALIESGGKVVQETRLYDSAKNVTQPMRSKEEAHDYRYFPDPDLLPLVIEQSQIDAIQASLPELPREKKIRYQNEFGLSSYDAMVLTQSQDLSQIFESTLAILTVKKGAKTLSNFLSGEISRLMNEKDQKLSESKINSTHLARLVEVVSENVISSTGAKKVLSVIWETGQSVDEVIESEGLKQVSDMSALEPLVEEVLANNPNQVQQFRDGKEKLLGFFVGQVMKVSQGKANPERLKELLISKLKK
ncbi:MAG: Asp-tRNA(Asn)/Glu-tRNA(Gln) amidotransferase GatCAB subunit B [Bdellovibrionaceae bacterium]|nr:Asp-tRNA(Asn)/Glu-tRNA(Gln) amidotransferase GatCAB subunit B [Pseudobdellovibrionaceae bacterium]